MQTRQVQFWRSVLLVVLGVNLINADCFARHRTDPFNQLEGFCNRILATFFPTKPSSRRETQTRVARSAFKAAGLKTSEVGGFEYFPDLNSALEFVLRSENNRIQISSESSLQNRLLWSVNINPTQARTSKVQSVAPGFNPSEISMKPHPTIEEILAYFFRDPSQGQFLYFLRQANQIQIRPDQVEWVFRSDLISGISHRMRWQESQGFLSGIIIENEGPGLAQKEEITLNLTSNDVPESHFVPDWVLVAKNLRAAFQALARTREFKSMKHPVVQFMSQEGSTYRGQVVFSGIYSGVMDSH